VLQYLFKNHGVLGLNARNLLYIKPYNPRKAVAFADNKLKTKAYLSARGVPVAKIYARIETREQLRAFDFSSLPDECVLKPNYGFGGEGIIILRGRRHGEFLENGKRSISNKRLIEHIEDILDGKFSVNGRLDTAFFEKILVPHDGFAPFRPAGLPDVRIIVFNLVPVMAMLRVPTPESEGKANVHQGGLGIGIDIAKGITTHATQYNRIVHALPHGIPSGGIPVPYWEEMLLIASKIQYITNIGYLAVDLTIDKDQGPVLLEVNARAGLMVQVANLAPLKARLDRVQGLQVSTPEKGVRIAQELFGEKLPGKHQASETSRPVLSTRETIAVHAGASSIEVPAVLLPGALERTIFSPGLIEELRELGGIDANSDGTLRVKFTLGGRKIQTAVHEEWPPLPGVRAAIGRRDLADFLIDPARKSDPQSPASRRKVDLRAADRMLAQMDKDLLLLRALKPVNLREERQRIMEDSLYEPLFQYAESRVSLDDVARRLEGLELDTSPLGTLLQKKTIELQRRIDVLTSIGDTERFTAASIALYGAPDEQLRADADGVCRTMLSQTSVDKGEVYTAEQAAEQFLSHLEKYSLHDWQVVIRDTLVADCTVGWKRLYLRKGATFTKDAVASLIAHEIETHIFTLENGIQQPFELFRRGFAGYLDTQEGLAVYSQNNVLPAHHEKRIGPARSVMAVAYSLDHTFAETRKYLEEELAYTREKAVTKCIELKRGLRDTATPGGFTKGIVYLRGLRAVEAFVAQGHDLHRLFIGKIALEDLQLAESIPGIQSPVLLPAFLREPSKATMRLKIGSSKTSSSEEVDHDEE
jgi:alpha-L-glutamate ligase-like protein/uncharacterized protein (TIGR02421 family)